MRYELGITKFLITLFYLISSLDGIAQVEYKSRIGSLYFYWGWNRDFYSKSDIHFKGEDYDFTIYKVRSVDRPRHFNFENYFYPNHITIPQYNFRIGYYINDHYDISFGSDHMKYVVKNFQYVAITGHIDKPGNRYDGIYHDNLINLDTNFLEFEHTDGLNYANFEIRRSDQLFQKRFFTLESRLGAGAGILFPRTRTTLLGMQTHDEFHLSGYGLGLVAGLHFGFFKNFFVQFESKAGYINMPDILTTYQKTDKASQSFFFSQFNVVFGLKFNVLKHKDS